MTQEPIPQPSSLKPSKWWKAGLLGALVSFVCLFAYLVFANDMHNMELSELLFIGVLILPSLIYTAIYTARNRTNPKNLTNTILVSLLCISIPAFFATWFIAALGSMFEGGIIEWAMKHWFDITLFIFFILAATAIVASILWNIFGRKYSSSMPPTEGF